MKKELIKLLDKLPAESGILGSRNYFKSVILIPFVKIENLYHILFEKRANGIRQDGEISCPGGGFDAVHDKNYQETAIRETCEELGVPEKYSRPWGNKLYSVYVYRVKDEIIWGITGQILFELMQV
ncbi:MAG: NUDIX domain-containing protein [Candidatus Cloacimonadales bacterium]|nr:NUDIX domain-containing protein [Candidatus Cloacimonadales bacterium]